jgi:hypothetical protein
MQIWGKLAVATRLASPKRQLWAAGLRMQHHGHSEAVLFGARFSGKIRRREAFRPGEFAIAYGQVQSENAKVARTDLARSGEV